MSDAFAYEPLPGASYIRLLKIHDSSQTEIISITLSTVPLSDKAIPYIALSYTWTSQYRFQETNNRRHSIICNGKPMVVLENLHAALYQLRSARRIDHIWADYICINQADNVEKSEQVPLMGQIYTTAECVLVWLGEGLSRDIDRRTYELLLWASPHRTLHPWRKSSGPWRMPPLTTLLNLFNDLKADSASDAHLTTSNAKCEDIEELLERPWFSRRWIVQEICNAQEATVMFGTYELSWIDFTGALDTLTSAADDTRALQKYSAARLMIWRNGVKVDSVLHAMETFHDFAGTDDRDRVAAFLNLGWPRTSLGSDFVVDYSHSVDYNYYRFAKHMVDIGKGAEVLVAASYCYRSIEASQGSLPSWVPDWRTMLRRRIRSSVDGTFNVSIANGNCLKFSGQIAYVFVADVKDTATGSGTVAEAQHSQILPRKGDIICRLTAKEGYLDPNGIVLRRYKQSDCFSIVASYLEYYNLGDADWAASVSIPEGTQQPQHFLVK